MSSQDMADKLRLMAESPAYAMRREVLLVSAQNLEVMESEMAALKRTNMQLTADLEAAKKTQFDLGEEIAKVYEDNKQLRKELEAAKKQASFAPAFVSSAQNDELAKVKAELEAKNKYSAGIHARLIVSDNETERLKAELAEAREHIRYAIGGIDALLPDNADAGAIKATLEQALKAGE